MWKNFEFGNITFKVGTENMFSSFETVTYLNTLFGQ